jgi:hypothetical protein
MRLGRLPSAFVLLASQQTRSPGRIIAPPIDDPPTTLGAAVRAHRTGTVLPFRNDSDTWWRSEAEITEAVEVGYLFGGTAALVMGVNAFKSS